MKLVKHWQRLPREVVDVPFLETFQIRLDGALRADLVEDVPADCREVGIDECYSTLPTKTIP